MTWSCKQTIKWSSADKYDEADLALRVVVGFRVVGVVGRVVGDTRRKNDCQLYNNEHVCEHSLYASHRLLQYGLNCTVHICHVKILYLQYVAN